VSSNQVHITITDDNFTTASVTLEPQDVSNQNPSYPADKGKKLLFQFTLMFLQLPNKETIK
jgi:hypothetical protein